jgi:thioredoxin-related protein
MKPILFLFLFLFNGIAFATEPVFTDNFKDAINISNDKNIPIVLIFGQESCNYCNKLKSDINSGELDSLLENKIICYIDILNNKDFIEEYEIKKIPDSRILLNNKVRSKITGYDKVKYKTWLSSN